MTIPLGYYAGDMLQYYIIAEQNEAVCRLQKLKKGLKDFVKQHKGSPLAFFKAQTLHI